MAKAMAIAVLLLRLLREVIASYLPHDPLPTYNLQSDVVRQDTYLTTL